MYKIKVDGECLYHPWNSEFQISAGNTAIEIGKNGTCNLDVPFTNPILGKIKQRKSIIEIIRFGDGEEKTIYRGLVMDIDSSLAFENEIKTEGDLVLLNDTVIRPHDRTLAAEEEFRKIIEEHNRSTETFKRFQIGTVRTIGDVKRRYQSGYVTTYDAVNELLASYGGYIRTRTKDDVHYIDWISAYTHKSTQKVEYGKNVLDLSAAIKADNVITRLIPLGKVFDGVPVTIKSVNNGIDYIEDTRAIEEYGLIEKTVEFQDLENPADLKKAAQNYFGDVCAAITSIDVRVVDLADAGYDVEYLAVGDIVDVKIANFHGAMQISKVVIDLKKPSNSSVTLGATLKSYTQLQTSRGEKMAQTAALAAYDAANSIGAITKIEPKGTTIVITKQNGDKEEITIGSPDSITDAEILELLSAQE